MLKAFLYLASQKQKQKYWCFRMPGAGFDGDLCSYMNVALRCCSVALSACSPSYRPTHWAVPERPAFLHTVCLSLFSSSLQTLSLPPSSLRSHADPPVQLTAQMATGKPDSTTPTILRHNGPFLSEFWPSLVLSEGLICQELWELRARSWTAIFREECKLSMRRCTNRGAHTLFIHAKPAAPVNSRAKSLYVCSGDTFSSS